MTAGNGFLTVAPDARYGDTATNNPATTCYTGKFTAPSTGTLTISEIGCYGARDVVGTHHIILAIYTHDAANSCPDVIVTNSTSDELVMPATTDKLTHTYGTQPTVTGGSIYWITLVCDSAFNFSRFATGGTSGIRTSVTYPTYPTGDDWHSSWTGGTRDTSFYVVYSAGAAATPINSTPSDDANAL